MPNESITIRPPPADWPALIRRNASEPAVSFRRELGLPTDGPIIMTGHQAEFWHPGILAKYLAADAAASKANAAVAWLVVDQDRAQSVPLRYPVIETNGGVAVATAHLTHGTAAVRERSLITTPEPDRITAGLARITATMSAHASEPNLSHQIAASLADLLRPLIRLSPTTLFATDLHRTSFFRDLIARMAREPESCCRAYNAAVARRPSARIRPLIADDIQDRFEVPLWHLPPGKPRTHVYAEELASIPTNELAPKALLMTGLLRLAGCDLFIHGTGGGGLDDEHEGYDQITDDWLNAWLGPQTLTPITTVTATRFLPLPIPDPPTPAAAARAVWLAHAAPHNPHIIRDGYFDDAKRRLVLQIAAAPHPQRAALFRQMHALLDDYRRTHDADLRAIGQDAATMQNRLASAPIAFDRTWPFPLYPDAILAGLRDEIAAAFGVAR